MKIVTTAILLVITLIVAIYFSLQYGTSLNDLELHGLKVLVIICAISSLYCFLIGEWTANNSQVDKLWSILPPVYVWLIAYYSEWNHRLVLMAILTSLWGIRLTYNFSLKGAYQLKFWLGEEDYRWKILKKKPEFQAKWKWTLFNLFFISLYQNFLILLFTLPALIALQFKQIPLTMWDYLFSILMLVFIVLEAIADLQMWKFQNEKLDPEFNSSNQHKRGFIQSGLWAYSRHPNYFAEQSIWLCFYLIAAAASGQWLNWSITGLILLVLLFQGSANFSEEISASKYPEYQNYQKTVSKFIPWFK
ncbi:MAG TPA: DUF1295 domain-containing protein [Saprospiraceae bacterium]|nr:DUF1295 domain-containing protein [Saprospiraceae bacterium]